MGEGHQDAVVTMENAAVVRDPHYGKFSNDRSLSQAEITR